MRKSDSVSSLSLADLLLQRLQLEGEIVSQDGEITDEQDTIWRNQEVQIKDKVDAYGYVLSKLESELEEIKTLKREVSDRFRRAENRAQSNIGRLKQRLNLLSEGSPLRGHIYSFHPYSAVKREVTNVDLVEDSLVNLTIEISEANWKSMLARTTDVPEFKILKRAARVAQLPENHPAVKLQRTASVRVS